jgi:hypothetical protein
VEVGDPPVDVRRCVGDASEVVQVLPASGPPSTVCCRRLRKGPEEGSSNSSDSQRIVGAARFRRTRITPASIDARGRWSFRIA